MSDEITTLEIKTYLKNHPEFFEQNAAFLADIHLPSPHGSGTISLAERQQLAQRDKINALESRFTELVLNAQENDAIARKIHTFNLQLHRAKNFDTIEQLISHNLPEFFDLSDTCLRIWAQPLEQSTQANLVFSGTSDEVKAWIGELTTPFCGQPPAVVGEDWFIDPPKSLTVIPLRNTQIFGFLALASDNENRFYDGMGTDFLNKIGEVVAGALSRHFEPV